MAAEYNSVTVNAMARTMLDRTYDEIVSFMEKLAEMQKAKNVLKLTKEQTDAVQKIRTDAKKLSENYDFREAKRFVKTARDAVKNAGFNDKEKEALLKAVDRVENCSLNAAHSADMMEGFLKMEEEYRDHPSVLADIYKIEKSYFAYAARCQENMERATLYNLNINSSFKTSTEIAEKIKDAAEQEGLLVTSLDGYGDENISIVCCHDEETLARVEGIAASIVREYGIVFHERNDFLSSAEYTGNSVSVFSHLTAFEASRLQEALFRDGVTSSVEHSAEHEENDVCSVAVYAYDAEKAEKALLRCYFETHGFGENTVEPAGIRFKEKDAAMKLLQSAERGKTGYVFDMADPAHCLAIDQDGMYELKGGKQTAEILRSEPRRFERRCEQTLENFSSRFVFVPDEEAARFKISRDKEAGTVSVGDNKALAAYAGKKTALRGEAGDAQRTAEAAKRDLLPFLTASGNKAFLQAVLLEDKSDPSQLIEAWKKECLSALRSSAEEMQKAGKLDKEASDRIEKRVKAINREYELLSENKEAVVVHLRQFVAAAAEKDLVSFLIESTGKDTSLHKALQEAVDDPAFLIDNWKTERLSALQSETKQMQDNGKLDKAAFDRVGQRVNVINAKYKFLTKNKSAVAAHMEKAMSAPCFKKEEISLEAIKGMDLTYGQDEEVERIFAEECVKYDMTKYPEKYTDKGEKKKAREEKQEPSHQKSQEYYNNEYAKRVQEEKQKAEELYEARSSSGRPARKMSDAEIEAKVIRDLTVEDTRDVLIYHTTPMLKGVRDIAANILSSPAFDRKLLNTAAGHDEALKKLIRDEIDRGEEKGNAR